MLLYIFLIIIWIGLTIAAFCSYRQRMKVAHLQTMSNANQNIKFYGRNYIVGVATLLIGYALLFIWLIITEANPTDTNITDSDYIFVLDISNSMNANDLENGLTRIEAAKKTISDIIYELNSYNQIGLVIFAGQAQTIAPLTNDRTYLLQILDAITTNYIGNNTTNLQVAIETGIAAFESNAAAQASSLQIPQHKKKLVILTDGENHYGDLSKFNNSLKQKKIELFAVGLGTEQGSMIPMNANAQSNDYLKDINGRDVITKLNTNTLKTLSENYFIYPVTPDNVMKIVNN